MKRIIGCFALLLLSPTVISARPQSNPLTLPSPPTSTIPSEALYALGQQNGQLTSISNRLDKIETKLDGFQQDMTRIDTIMVGAGLFITVFWGPVAVERWKHVFVSKPH